jgi:protein arginine kinase
MVNEEDHVRIQSIYSGFDLDKAYEKACLADDALSKSVDIAFDENLGYITACPTNLGTGLRASVMVHLPAICAYGYIRTLISLMTKIGLTVRGMYGEGSEGKACMYQISNQVTLGISEKDAVEKLKNAVNQIISKEQELRKNIISSGDIAMTDKIWRSYGELKYARSIDTAEASRLISNVRLGAVCGIIPECKDKNLVKLLFEIMPAHIMSRFSDASSPEKRDEYRATYIREALE